jgi:hypothetical protein
MTSLDTLGNDLKSILMVNFINIFHILFVGPLLIYTSTRCNKGDTLLKLLLLLLGLMVIAAHIYFIIRRARIYGN